MKKLLKDKQDADKIVHFIRQGTEDTKLKENTSMELYQKMQSPITTEIEQLGKKIEDAPFTHVLPMEEPYYREAIEDENKKHIRLMYFMILIKKY